VYRFPKNLEALQNPRCQKDDTKQVHTEDPQILNPDRKSFLKSWQLLRGSKNHYHVHEISPLVLCESLQIQLTPSQDPFQYYPTNYIWVSKFFSYLTFCLAKFFFLFMYLLHKTVQNRLKPYFKTTEFYKTMLFIFMLPCTRHQILSSATCIQSRQTTTSLTPSSRVLLVTLIGSQLVKKFPAFYGTRRFITAFKSTRHVSPS